MNVIVLDGSTNADVALKKACESINIFFKTEEHLVKVFKLSEMSISQCCGYFQCWIKTPGVCIIKDRANDIVQCAVNSDCWIFLTPLTFGGYSFELKKAIDRMPPVMLPYFEKVNNEVHHKSRYNKRPHLVVIGSADKHNEEQEEIFTKLVKRNSINFHNASAASKIVLSSDSSDYIKNIVIDVLAKIG